MGLSRWENGDKRMEESVDETNQTMELSYDHFDIKLLMEPKAEKHKFWSQQRVSFNTQYATDAGNISDWRDERVCTCANKFVRESQSCENADNSRCHYDGHLLRRRWNSRRESTTKCLSWQTRGWRSWPFDRVVCIANEMMMEADIYEENANSLALTTHCQSVALWVWATGLFQTAVFQTSCIWMSWRSFDGKELLSSDQVGSQHTVIETKCRLALCKESQPSRVCSFRTGRKRGTS